MSCASVSVTVRLWPWSPVSPHTLPSLFPSLSPLFLLLLNTPVLARNVKRCGSAFCIATSFDTSWAILPAFTRSASRGARYLGQCKTMCAIVSSPWLHAGHLGESSFPIRCRCLASGMWPVHICVSRLACFRDNGATSLRNF